MLRSLSCSHRMAWLGQGSTQADSRIGRRAEKVPRKEQDAGHSLRCHVDPVTDCTVLYSSHVVAARHQNAPHAIVDEASLFGTTTQEVATARSNGTSMQDATPSCQCSRISMLDLRFSIVKCKHRNPNIVDQFPSELYQNSHGQASIQYTHREHRTRFRKTDRPH